MFMIKSPWRIQTAGGKGVTHQGEEVLQDQALKDSHDL